MADAAGLAHRTHESGGAHDGRPPLLLIHGAGGNRLSWPPQVRRLAGVRVISLDLPGHGESGGRPEATISGYAEGLLDWLRSVGESQVIAAGHSMGGAIALTMALRRPAQLGGLVLVATSARLRVAPNVLRDSASRGGFPQAVEWYLRHAFSQGAPESLVARVQETALSAGHEVFHADFQACDRFDVRSRLEEIRVPSLVISGADDELTPVRFGQALAAGLPQGEFVSIEGVGHMLPLERPQELADEVTRFLAALGGRG